MIESTPISVKVSTQDLPFEVGGIGKVVRSEDQYYLDVGSTKIYLGELSDASFSDGEIVRYYISNNKITITSMQLVEATTKESIDYQLPPNISDSLNQSDLLTTIKSTENNEDSIKVSATLQNVNLPIGIYIFLTPEEAFSFLRRFGVAGNAIEDKILSLFTKSNEIALKIEEGFTNDTIKINILDLKELQLGISELIGLFKSSQMRAVSSDIFEEILADKGSLLISSLANLDETIRSVEDGFPLTRAGSEVAQKNAFLQWLKSALIYSDRILPSEIVKIAPLYKAESIIKDLENALQFISTLKDNEEYKKVKEVLQKFLIGNTLPKEDFLRKCMEDIGLNFEYQLANESKLNRESVKTTILLLRELINRETQNFDYSYDKIEASHEIISNIRKGLDALLQELDHNKLSRESLELLTKYKEIDIKHIKQSELSVFIKSINELLNSNHYLKPSETSLIQEILKNAEKLYRIIGTKKENGFSDSSFLQKEIEPLNTTNFKQYSMSTHNQIIKILDGLIDKIESFQLLAQKLQNQNGTSQIISLPIKIGEDWTEISVQLFNSKQKKRGRKSQKFSVFIDIAPTLLGSIHLQLDYNQHKKLQLFAEFEKNQTYDWFSKHKEELINTISSYGISVFSLDFRKKNSILNSKKSYPKISKKGAIDIKI